MNLSGLRFRTGLMPDPSDPKSPATHLRLIAGTLDASPGASLGDEPDDDQSELLRFWTAINDAQARRRVLNLARQEAARCGYREPE